MHYIRDLYHRHLPEAVDAIVSACDIRSWLLMVGIMTVEDTYITETVSPRFPVRDAFIETFCSGNKHVCVCAQCTKSLFADTGAEYCVSRCRNEILRRLLERDALPD